ncbi:MAG: alpha/beta fold hydrolase [Myxococcota bacterium]
MPSHRSGKPPIAPRIRAVRLDDIEIACTEIEAAPNADAPARTLVLLHGLTGHRDDFLPLLSSLHAHDRSLRLLAPDLRGHGDSTHTGDPATFCFDRLVEDLGLLLDRLAIDRCDLVGHSFGGMVALRFALATPARLASLLLVGTAPFAPDAFRAETFEKSGDLAIARGMSFLQARIEERARAGASNDGAQRIADRWADAYWAHHRHRFRSMDPVAYRELGLTMVRQRSLEQRLCELSLPASVVVGEHDADFLAGAARIAEGIPGCIRFEIPDAGHHPHRENPDAFLAALSAHLERPRTPPRTR